MGKYIQSCKQVKTRKKVNIEMKYIQVVSIYAGHMPIRIKNCPLKKKR